MNSKKDIGALCRIKVNKMLTSLNSNKNIFIPNYTLFNKNEEKYSYLNKTKGNSTKVNKNKKNLKDEMNINNIRTNEENYNNQPIDFIINHGILVYQRNFKGEEIINLGINNEYLKKNNFSMNKKDSTIYRTESNFRHKDKKKNNDSTFNNYSKQSWSIKKKINTNGSKKTFVSTSDIPLSKNKNSSSRQKKILSTNLNTTQNSISSINSFSVKTFLVSSKNKNDNSPKKSVNENEKNNSNQKVKNTKRVINFVKKKKNSTNNQNKFLIFKKKKKNSSTFAGKEEKIQLNNKIVIKDNKIIPNIIDKKYKTNYNSKNETLDKNKNVNNTDNKVDRINYNKDQFNNLEMIKNLSQLFIDINKMKNHYINICFEILKEYNKNTNIFKVNNINLDIYENKINKIEINEKILERCKQNKNFQNSHHNPEHEKSNSIIVNKIMSSNTASTKELQKNNSNSNLSYLISKNLKFFSKEKDDKNEKRPELYRDSKSLQKKYEQICRRKKRQLTMTFTTRFKDITIKKENNNLNKTNSFPNLDKNS